jgi:hypothetical protein
MDPTGMDSERTKLEVTNKDRRGHGDSRLAARSFANANSFISQLNVQSLSVDCGVHRHARDAHLMSGTNDTHCNFPPVCHQYFLKFTGHGQSSVMHIALALVASCYRRGIAHCLLQRKASSPTLETAPTTLYALRSSD